jgi:hypothetical protein
LEKISPGLYCEFDKIAGRPATKAILSALPEVRVEFIRLTVDAVACLRGVLGDPNAARGRYWNLWHQEGYPSALLKVSRKIFRKTLPFTEDDLLFLTARLADLEFLTVYPVPLVENVVAQLEAFSKSASLSQEMLAAMQRLRAALDFSSAAPEQKLRRRLGYLAETTPVSPSIACGAVFNPGFPMLTAAQVIKTVTLFADKWGDFRTSGEDPLESMATELEAIGPFIQKSGNLSEQDCAAVLEQVLRLRGDIADYNVQFLEALIARIAHLSLTNGLSERIGNALAELQRWLKKGKKQRELEWLMQVRLESGHLSTKTLPSSKMKPPIISGEAWADALLRLV